MRVVIAEDTVLTPSAGEVRTRALRLGACAVALASVVMVTLGALAIFGVLSLSPDGVPPSVLPFFAVAVLTPAIVGLLIAIRKPRNPIAWILLLGALAVSVDDPVDFLWGEGWALQTGRATWPMLYAWPIAVAYVFPDGRLLSRRWRWVAGAAIVSFVGFMTSAMLDPGPFEPPDASVANPLAGNDVGEFIGRTSMWMFWLGILASLFAGALAIGLRLRRSTGRERLQTLWLAWAAALIPLGLLGCVASWTLFEFAEVIVYPFLLVMQAAMAAAVGIAVARYRLYAIERLINRTVVYVALTILLAGTYAAIALGLGVAAGRGSAWITALATLAVALAFRPLRSRIQDVVDRRFDRARYEAVRQVQAFEQQVREGRRAPEEIGRVLTQALRDALAELLFWLPASETYAAASGELIARLPDDGRARSEIERDGARTAVLLHDPALLDRRSLLEGILAAAALSIEIARLRVEVRQQLAEVEASRTRIVEAGYEERRRLERDLHDGAQQRLVSLGVQIRRLQHSLPAEARLLRPTLDQIVTQLGAAIADLRQIAAGVRPARLDDGLAAAMRDLAGNAPVPVEVEAPIGRVAASVEAAAYFVACEALTNAVKHASPSRVALRAVKNDGTLLVSVSDDGIGGASPRRGSGLAGLQDRLAAHGGTLTIASSPGHGTCIEAVIPCES